MIGRPFALFPCAINGDLFLFLLFDFEFLSWNILCSIFSMISIVTVLALVVVEMLREMFCHCLIPLQMETDRRVLFDWKIIAFCHVKCYQSWRFCNLLFRMLVDYWGDILLVGSWMGQSLHMFYRHLFFCARFWVFRWKFRMHVHFRSRVEEVGCHWLFYCLLLRIIFRHWAVERGQKWVWVDSNAQSCDRNLLWGRRRRWFRTQCKGE